MKQTIKMTGCIAAALALGGCQSFVSALGFGPKDSAQVEQRAELFGSEDLERGRVALKQGNIATAIQQFRMAALNEKTAPDAFNGLGVAYARLGRADLAERYFKTALELDSTNPRYAANLARFYESPLGTSARALAMRDREAEAMLAKAEREALEQRLMEPQIAGNDVEAAPVLVQAPAAAVDRTSDRELRISTASDSSNTASANAPVVAVRPATEVQPRPSQDRPRISLTGASSDSKAQTRTRPARITVSRAGGRWASRPRAASYPIRVALKRED
jgi:hypothetical protein